MRTTLLITCFVVLANFLKAQDRLPLNPLQSLIYVNPSFAGSNGSLRDQFVSNSVFPNSPANHVMYYNAIDGYSKRLRGGLALSGMLNDMAQGTYREVELNGVYAPVFECKSSGLKVIPSLQLSYVERSVDFTKLTFGQGYIIYNPDGLPARKKGNFDASAGLLFNYKNLYAGASLFHVNQPDVGLGGTSKLPSRFSANASYALPLNEKTLVALSAVFTQQANYRTFQIAANAIVFRRIIAGVGYHSGSVCFGSFGYRDNFFSVTGGYNFSYSPLAVEPYGSWQLGLALSLRKKEKGQAPLSFETW